MRQLLISLIVFYRSHRLWIQKQLRFFASFFLTNTSLQLSSRTLTEIKNWSGPFLLWYIKKNFGSILENKISFRLWIILSIQLLFSLHIFIFWFKLLYYFDNCQSQLKVSSFTVRSKKWHLYNSFKSAEQGACMYNRNYLYPHKILLVLMIGTRIQ